MPDELTSSEIAKLLGVTRKTIKVWRDSGKIAFRPIPLAGDRAAYAYPRSEVERLKKERKRRSVKKATKVAC